jgi:hypothetical protein
MAPAFRSEKEISRRTSTLFGGQYLITSTFKRGRADSLRACSEMSNCLVSISVCFVVRFSDTAEIIS